MKKLNDIFKERKRVVLRGIIEGIIKNMDSESGKELASNCIYNNVTFLSTMHDSRRGKISDDELMESLIELRKVSHDDIFNVELDESVYDSIIKEHDECLIKFREQIHSANSEEALNAIYGDR